MRLSRRWLLTHPKFHFDESPQAPDRGIAGPSRCRPSSLERRGFEALVIMALSRDVLDAPAITRMGKTASMEAIDAALAAERAWAAVKKQIAERDRYGCRLCGKACRYGDPIQTRADAHHIIFASQGGLSKSWNLLLLCRSCHDLVHKVRKFYLSGNADDRDEMGNGMVKVERQVEGGFETIGFI